MSGFARQVKYGVLMSYISIGINILTGLLYTPWMIHSIGRENYGLYTLALSIISLFVFDFGLSAAVTRFISKSLANNDQNDADRCLGVVYKIYLLLDVALLAILSIVFFLIPHIYKELSLDEIEKLKVIYVIVATYSVISFPFIPVNGILTAHEKFISLRISDIFHKIFIVIFMSIALMLGYGLYALVLIHVLSGIFTIVLKLYFIKTKTNQKVLFSSSKDYDYRQILTFSGWTTIQSLSQRCIFNLAPSILAALAGSVEVAILGVATTLEGYVYTFANAISGMFLPKVSRIYHQGDGNILPLMIKIGRLQVMLVFFLLSGIICFGSQFINLWVGSEFAQCYLCAILLILPSIIHLPQEIGKQAILAMNKVKYQAIVYLVMAILNLLLVFLLAPRYGSYGVCLSICISYFVRTIGMDLIMYKKLGIDILTFLKSTYLGLLCPLGAAILIGMIINVCFAGYSGWLILLTQVLLYTIVYFAILFFFGMNSSEKNLIYNIFNNNK